MNSNFIVIYCNDYSIFEWFTEQVPVFRAGETLWLEMASYPAWQDKQPEVMKLTEFKIISISHSILRTYTDDISTFYKMKVMVKLID